MSRRGTQGALDLGDVAGPRVGRVERRTAAAIAHAKRGKQLEPVDDGLAALAVELARSVDVASRKPDPYGVAAAGRELREVMSRLKLDPTSRGVSSHDPFAEFLAGLGGAEVGDPADPGPA